MKPFLPGFVLALLLSQPAASDQSAPPNLRVQTEWIEMPLESLNQLLSKNATTGRKFHNAVRQLASNNQAKLIHSSLILTMSGQYSLLNSGREIIYPTEIEGSGLSGSLTKENQARLRRLSGTFRPHPPVFETRKIGCILELEATLGNDPNLIDLRLDQRWIQMPSIYRWTKFKDQWGEADIKRPIFYTLRTRNGLTLSNGHYQFVSSFNAMDAQGKADPERVLLFFIKATVQPIPTP